jgi:TRAP-type C4-dicarboxylate transport system permease small subunit
MFYRPDDPEPAVLRRLGDLIDLVVVLLGSGMVVLMSVNVFARTTNLIDLAANVELGEFLLVWATFLGGASAVRRVRLGALLDQATRLLTMGLLALITWKGISIVGSTWSQKSSVLYWPIGLTYLALPVGAALCMVYLTFHIVRPPSPAQTPDVS